MNKLVGPLFLGVILSGCTPVRYDSFTVYQPGHHHVVLEKPVVAYSPQKDVMTEVGVVDRDFSASYAIRPSVNMTAPAVLLGPGAYHEKRYSPSIFK